MADAVDGIKKIQVEDNRQGSLRREDGWNKGSVDGGRKLERGRTDCIWDSYCEVRILEGFLWSLNVVCILKENGRRTCGKVTSFHWLAGGKLRCPPLDQPQSDAEWRAGWWGERIGRLSFGKLA